MVDIEDPDFMFGDDGEIIQFSPSHRSMKTPTRSAGAMVSGDAGASARVRREHEEGRRAVSQVSYTALFHLFLHCDFGYLFCEMFLLLSLEFHAWLYMLSPSWRASLRRQMPP